MFHFIRRWKRSIHNIITFFPLIWRFRCWDQYFLLEYMAKGFEEFHKYYSDPKNVWMNDRHRLSVVRETLILKTLLLRMGKEDYARYWYNKVTFPEGDIIDVFRAKGKGFQAWSDNMKIVRKKEEEVFKQDMELFCKIFSKKIRTFWD